MDRTLAELYGTAKGDEDTEKLAAAEMAEALTEEEGIDLDGLTDEDLEAAAQEVLDAQDSDEEETEEETEKTAGTEEEQAEEVEYDPETVKIAEQLGVSPETLIEGDKMGRIMAHSMVAELKNIEKESGEEKKASVKGKVLRGLVHLKRGAKKVGKSAKRYGELMAGGEKPLVSGKHGNKRPGNYLKRHPKGSHWRSEQNKSLAARGATAVGAVGAGAAAKKAMDKKASALETLAEQRAQEILAENGIQVEETKVTKYDVLADAVESRAAEILTEAGYEFEESVEETKK